MLAQVLEVVKKQNEVPITPFPSAQQHVATVLEERAKRNAQEDDEDEGEVGDSLPTQRDKVDAKKKEREPQKYNEVRTKFIEASKGRGNSFFIAKLQWDNSKEKRQYLKDVSVAELKKRKFIKAGDTVNPWAS